MKLSLPLYLLCVAAADAAIEASSISAQNVNSIDIEDNEFWNRFLQADSDASFNPTSSPTDQPNVQCDVDVEINCVLEDGRPCNEAVPPEEGVCTREGSISVLTFSIQNCTCEESDNQQGDNGFCEDTAPLDTTRPVSVSCVATESGAQMIIEPAEVSFEEAFSVSNPTGDALPDKIRCEVTQGSETIQTITLDTSGSIQLELQDKFGVLKLESCDDSTCITTLCYTVDLSNTGTVEMDITQMDFNFNGDITDLIPNLASTTLVPGDVVRVEYKEEVNICTGEEFCAIVDAEADPPNGDMCQDQEEYKFTPPLPSTPNPTPVEDIPTLPPSTSESTLLVSSLPPTPTDTLPEVCNVEVEIQCKLEDGRECSEVGPPATSCVDGEDIDTITLSYTASTCNAAGNSQGNETFCEDFAPIDPAEIVTAECFSDEGAPLTVVPPTISLGSTFTVTNPNGDSLPGKIDCSILSSDGINLQQNIIDTSGDVALDLQDEFGALKLETCDELRCIETICYDIGIRNVGETEMDITLVNFTFNDESEDLLDEVETNPLIPGASTSLEVKKDINLCTNEEFCAQIGVEADPPNGEMCQDEDEYKFIVPALPTMSPTSTPRNPPTSPPTGQVTSQPTSSPTRPPTSPPTSSPSPPIQNPLPTSLPTTFPPSFVPTEQCTIDIDLNCTIAGGSNAGKACETPGIGIQPCLDRPTAATMLYNGGDCSQSDNRQFLQFSCEDFNGGPPTEEGAQSYIVVTDIKGQGITYFEGFVAVGENFRLNDGGERFEADQLIVIYSSNDTADGANLLQVVQYHSSCSSNLELKNRFGASQLVEFFNEVQGNVTCFAATTFTVDVAVPIEFEGDSATIQSLTALTNFAGLVNLTDELNGVEIAAGETLPVTINGTLDLTVRQRYTILITLEATANPSGVSCIGRSFESFIAGNPAVTPTAMPTRSPTISPAPTGDLATAACSVEAEIGCDVLRNGRPVGDCASLVRDATGTECFGPQAFPTALQLIYRSDGTLPTNVVIQAVGRNSDTSVNAVDGEVVTVLGVFRQEAELTIFSADANGTAGDEVLSLTIETSCLEEGSLVIGNMYGPFELVGFDNSRGSFSSIFPVRLFYVVKNGPTGSVIDTANIESDIRGGGLFNAIENGIMAGRSDVNVVFTETATIDASAKERDNVTFEFAMAVSAAATVSGIPCSDDASYSF